MNKARDMAASAHWKVDKTVSLPMVGAFVVQTFLIGWYLSAQNERLGSYEKRADGFQPSIEKIIEIKTTVGTMKEDIADIKTILRTARFGSNLK